MLFAAMLLVSINIVAANYITLGDSVRINPRYLVRSVINNLTD